MNAIHVFKLRKFAFFWVFYVQKNSVDFLDIRQAAKKPLHDVEITPFSDEFQII